MFDGQIDLRVVFDKFRNDFGQSITRLSMRCRDGQRAAVMIGKLAADILMFCTSRKIRSEISNTALPGWRNGNHAFAAADKNLDAQFFFKQADLFGNAGLGCKKRIGGFGDIQIVSVNLKGIT